MCCQLVWLAITVRRDEFEGRLNAGVIRVRDLLVGLVRLNPSISQFTHCTIVVAGEWLTVLTDLDFTFEEATLSEPLRIEVSLAQGIFVQTWVALIVSQLRWPAMTDVTEHVTDRLEETFFRYSQIVFDGDTFVSNVTHVFI
ncbi:hypothetical protein D3C87_1341190 [compost metagenome]